MDKKEIVELFATNLRIERARKRLSQEKLAEMANITPEYLSRIESGRYNPTLAVVVNLSNALKIKIDDLVKNS